MGQYLLVGLLLFLHCLKKLTLLVMLDNFLPCLPVAGQDLLLFINAKPHRLSFGKCHLHWP